MELNDVEILKEAPALFAVLVVLKIMTSFILDLITKFKPTEHVEPSKTGASEAVTEDRREYNKLQFELINKRQDDIFNKIDKLEERFNSTTL